MDLKEARQEIDSIDAALKELFIKRMSISKEIAYIKKKSGDAIYKPEREKEIIDKLTADVSEDIKEEYTVFIKKIMEISRNYQKKTING